MAGNTSRKNKLRSPVPVPGGSPFATDRDLAERYSVDRMTIWGWAKDGLIPAPLKLGRQTTRWRWDDIIAHEERLASEQLEAANV
ncbi:helix-turn-helix transcriptional regulator [Roseospirillum parvum]|uniref:Prophage CP4-57 regulatory protein (AlpA) n=1 Tax=Roseospirillum parvum TaxID=83401 RepID=A0A1G8E7Q6_9PROT|nr:hypothetical protein [Roseospirillum parvum]SDH65730.1 hypothetical protein SAMN05421742_10957 [Roseospirillum parvum]